MSTWWFLCLWMGAADSLVVVDESDTPPPAAEFFARPQVRAGLTSRFLANTHWRNTSVDAFQMWHLAQLRAEQDVGSAWRAVLEGWARWGALSKWPVQDLNWVGEVQLREAYVRWAHDAWSITLGNQLFAWGKSEFGAPADVLNPVDLRYDPTVAFVLPQAIRVPLFALTTSYQFADVLELQLVIAPFFTAHRLFYSGHDNAVLAGSNLVPAALSNVPSALTPNARDTLQQGFLGTSLPDAGVSGTSAALRAALHVGGWDMAATGYSGWDRTPFITIDPELKSLFTSASSLNQTGLVAAALRQRYLDGQRLFDVSYKRMTQLAIEAEGPIGPLLLRIDAGLGIGRVVYTQSLQSWQRQILRAQAGLEYLRGDMWFASLGTYATSVLSPPTEASLQGFEARDAPLSRAMAFAWGGAANIRWHWQEPDLEVCASAAYDVKLGDSMGWLQLAYKPWEGHGFAVGTFWLDGTPGTVGAQFATNKLVYAQYQAAW